MFGPIGMQELIIIFVIALIVFGPRKLPELGKSLGKSIAEFKRASNELRSTLEQEIRVEETRREVMEPIETVRREARAAVDAAQTAADAAAAETGETGAAEANAAQTNESTEASERAAALTGTGEPQETKA
jgi:TatA/E family protein of Tat protein translocase